jgi:hypothetical protein
MEVDASVPTSTVSGAGAGAKPKAGELDLEVPFVEKYRPILVSYSLPECAANRCYHWYHVHLQLSDIVGNEETITRLQAIAAEGNMPNIIIAVSTPTACRHCHLRSTANNITCRVHLELVKQHPFSA